jgi:hypothetical protein
VFESVDLIKVNLTVNNKPTILFKIIL